MGNDMRGYVLTLSFGRLDFETETCIQCGVVFAMTSEFKASRLAKPGPNGKKFYCPNGHEMHYRGGQSDSEKLKAAEARETALRDQLEAAVRDAEATKAALLRDRQRFANGVCPCCNRSFENVRRHMSSQHPDYDVTRVAEVAPAFKCSCGRPFRTIGGLHQHQTKQRGAGWYKPTASRWSAHLTVV